LLHPAPRGYWLIAEFLALYVVLPLLLFATGTGIRIYMAPWGAGLCAVLALCRVPDFFAALNAAQSGTDRTGLFKRNDIASLTPNETLNRELINP
jgi:hypothetical protein